MKVNIKEYGAVADGSTLCTKAIQDAIDHASLLGATVVVPEGTYRTGSLFLKQGMSLEVEKGAILLGSDNLADYKIENTRFEGRTCLWPLGLLNAQGLTGVHVYGEGVLDGNGIPFYTQFWYERSKAIEENRPFVNRDVMRPRLLFIDNCRSVTLEGLTLQNSAFWNVHLHHSSDIIVQNFSITAFHDGVRAASSDAIDIDACQRVVIRGCTFSTDDDCVCIKGGKGPDAHLINPPTQDILVEDCRFGFGHGVITFGSEAAFVKNVKVKSCLVEGENTLVRCKTRPDTVQIFENLVFEDITILDGGWLFDVRPWESRQDELLGENLPAHIQGMAIRNIKAYRMQSPGILGKSGHNLTMENVLLQSIEYTSAPMATGRLNRADEIEKQEAKPSKLSYDRSAGISFYDFYIDGELIDHDQTC